MMNAVLPNPAAGSVPNGQGRRCWQAVLVIGGLIGCASGVGLGLLALLASYGWARSLCDCHAVDGSADFLTAALFGRARVAAAGAAGVLVLAGCALVAGSGRFAPWCQSGAARLAADGGIAWRAWRRRYLRPRLLAWLGALVALGAACRLPGLVGTPPRGDEAFTYVHYASRPLFLLLSLYDQPNNHLLHSLLVHAVTGVLGGAMWAVRLTAFLAGLLLIPVTFAWGRRCAGTAVGLLAAALVAVATPLVEYSTNARGYTLLCLLAVIMFLAARPALRGRNRLVALGFVGSAGLGLYTVPTMVFPFLGCLLWLLTVERAAWRRLGLLAGLAAGLATVCYLPILATVGPSGLVGNEYVAPLSLSGWVAGAATLQAGIVQFWFGGRMGTALVVLALAVLGGWQLARRRPAALGPVLVLLVALLGLAVAMRRWPPPRVCLFLVPFLAVWVAAGCLVVPRGRRRWLLPITVLACQVWLLFHGDLLAADRETGTLADGAAVCDFLEPRFGATDRLLLQGPSDGPLLYHLYRRGLPNQWLLRPPEQAETVWILINEPHGQTLEAILAVNHLCLRAGASCPREVARCGGAVILQTVMGELQRLPADPGKAPA